MLGLQLIDPLLLKHPAIDPPREGKEKNGKKNQLILNGLTKPCIAQARCLRGRSWDGFSGNSVCGDRLSQLEKLMFQGQEANMVGVIIHTYARTHICMHACMPAHVHMSTHVHVHVHAHPRQLRLICPSLGAKSKDHAGT